MDFEGYLIEEEYPMLAIKNILEKEKADLRRLLVSLTRANTAAPLSHTPLKTASRQTVHRTVRLGRVLTTSSLSRIFVRTLDDVAFTNFGEIVSETNKDLIEQITSLIWAVNAINDVMIRERANAYETVTEKYKYK